MKRIGAILLAMLLAPNTQAGEIPDHVRYVAATRENNERAERQLRAALLSHDYSKLIPTNATERVLAGVFLGLSWQQEGSLSALGLQTYRSTADLSGLEFGAESVMAIDSGQRARLVALMHERVRFSAQATIRQPTAAELTLMWFFIGWDFEEPLFVVDDGKERYAFDFNTDGTQLEWIERLTAPCAYFAQSPEQPLSECLCFAAFESEGQWAVGVEPATQVCPSTPEPNSAPAPVETKQYAVASVHLLNVEEELAARVTGAEQLVELIQTTQRELDRCWTSFQDSGWADLIIGGKLPNQLKYWWAWPDGVAAPDSAERISHCLPSTAEQGFGGPIALSLRIAWPVGEEAGESPPLMPKQWQVPSERPRHLFADLARVTSPAASK